MKGMDRVHQLLIILTGLVFIASTSSAAQDDLGSLIRFHDEVKPSKHLSSTFEAKPWREREKQTVLRHLQAIQKRLPGLMRRATAYVPIRIYRTERLEDPRFPARAEVAVHRLAITDRFFLSGNRICILIHELVHLADPFLKTALSKEWVELVKPRMGQVRDSLKLKGVPAIKAATEHKDTDIVRLAIARKRGFPTYYASTSLIEALAEFTAYGFLDLGYSPPEAIKAFVKSKLLSTEVVPDPPSRHAHQGLAALENGRLDEAISAFDKAIKLDPDFAIGYEYRGRAWGYRKESDRALADFNQVISLTKNSGYSRGYYRRGHVWSKKREFDKAIADFSEVIRIDLSDVGKGLYTRGLVYTLKKDHDMALADFNEVIRLNPSHWKAYDYRASIWSDKKDYDMAIANYSEVIRLRPRDMRPHMDRARVRELMKDMDGAIADYTEAIRIDAGNVNAYMRRAKIYITQKAYAKAEADYTKIIDLDPKNVDHYLKRARARKSRKDLKGAIADYDTVLRLKPKAGAYYMLRGQTYMAASQYAKALADFQRAEQLIPPYYHAITSDPWIRKAKEALAK
jgi:tetratricopeptide (TPR) repeat protein